MTKKEKIVIKKEAKKYFYDFMDTRDRVYILMDEFKDKHGFIPEQYKSDIMLMNAYAEYKRFGGWRKIPGVKLIMNKSIQKYCQAKIKNPQPEKEMSALEMELYLTKKTNEIFESIEKAKKELKGIHRRIDKNLKI